jgi:hypothetical protein
MAMKMRMTMQEMELKYGIRDNLQLCTVVPYVDNITDMTMMGTTSATKAAGVGDVTAMVKYRLNTALGRQPIFAVGGGVKLATGISDVRDQMGDLIPLMMQPGTGTTDPMLGAWASLKAAPWGYHGGVMYEFGGTNADQHLHHGNAIMSNWTAYYTATKRLAVLTEYNYSYMIRDNVAGVSQVNTGGTTMDLTPGVQYQLLATTDLLAAYQFPIDTHLNGTQMKPAASLILGVRQVF